ncbi:glycosyltransferase [Microcella sp.]|uniref:glycosyltransferase n=1 Tax=Microcella sp. TaxID=1913979 RepID=UPI0025662998|nr:hypothetical protein [Microcella sp.]MBX9472730.1 hypothetical protein [Microcella sp.]
MPAETYLKGWGFADVGFVTDSVRSVARAAAGLAPAALVNRVLPPGQRFDWAHPTPAISPPDADIRVLVAPTNTAWQGWAAARAAEHLEGVGARTSGIVPAGGGFGFLSDQEVPPAEYRWSSRWQRAQRRAVLGGFTHVLLESGRPLFGDAFARPVEADIAALRRAGVSLALMLYGSEVRLPSRHLARMPDSPFAPGLWSATPALEAQALRTAALAAAFDGPVFVATPDLLLDVPEATWLPITIDPTQWESARAAFTHLDGPPIVSHVPSSAVVKGTDLIEPVLTRLHDEGLIRYSPIRGLKASDMPAAYTGADIVLDQFRIGTYGVAAVEAMAAGRFVISNVGEQVRGEVERQLGETVPIIEATASTFEQVLRAVVADPEVFRAEVDRGPGFARRHHDGRRAAEVLSAWLTGSAQKLVD